MEKVYNALQGMKFNSLFASTLVAVLLAGCASEPEVRRSENNQRRAKRAKPTGWASGQVASDDKAMSMEMSMGVLDEHAVDRAIKAHERALASCFSNAGDARKYLSGQIVMRFVVAGTGHVSDVHVIKNGLGNYSVESCLVIEGKQIRFPAPEGQRGTDFEYSMNFQSTGERSVIPWSGEEMARHISSVSGDLANCGTLGNTDVDVIAYVEPGGQVGSVGFASEGSLDPTAAVCAVALMRKVRINDAPVGRSTVLRATFPLTLAFERPVGESTRRLAKHSKRRP
jgi:hypothetical protein